VYLSDIELYYTPSLFKKDLINLKDEEFYHCIKVMRNRIGDEIYITNGAGKIFYSIIEEIKKDFLTASVKKVFEYKNKYSNLFFCLTKLRNNSRFEFALEKCTELGITNFIIYDSSRSLHKKEKTERWNKIVLAAMKQSLRSFLPSIKVSSFDEIINSEGEKVLLEQNSQKHLSELKMIPSVNYNFIFGPEGGFTLNEINLFNKDYIYRLADNRLRTETAIIKSASLLCN
jgi:16S rRNA (uracil1498-N3)-methyltransferase